MERLEFVEHIKLEDDLQGIRILDQSKLPNEEVYKVLKTDKEMYFAIKNLEVRGAPAIGIFAAYALFVLANKWQKREGDFFDCLHRNKEFLNLARPTAVNLSWALNRMENIAIEHKDKDVSWILQAMERECRDIHREDIEMCKTISEYGLSLVKDGDGILTHCNAGPLATSKYGTALGPILLGKERGMNFHVFSDETRPLLQGARLTSWELSNAGVEVTLICDNMASIVMKNGWIQACFVGCDRVAANGDVANKIGTSGVAILAKYYGIPFYVLGPTSTIDLNCPDGEHIPIELRNPDEIKSMWYKEPMAPDVDCYNPSFDVTDHNLIAAIVTEKGICREPYTESLENLFK